MALHEALKECGDLLWATAATGGGRLRLLPENIDAFASAFASSRPPFPTGPPPAELVLDVEAPLSALTLGLLDDLDRLEPYGAENRRPLFLAGGLQVQGEPRKVGGGERHLEFPRAQRPT